MQLPSSKTLILYNVDDQKLKSCKDSMYMYIVSLHDFDKKK